MTNINSKKEKTIRTAIVRILGCSVFFSIGYFARGILERKFMLINQKEYVVLAVALLTTAILVLLYIAFQRKETAKVLVTANQRYEDLMDNIQGGVITCIFDKKTQGSKATYINSGWTELTGYTMEELEEAVNGNPQALILQEDGAMVYKEYMKQTAMGRSYNLEYRIKRKDGSIIWTIDRGLITIDNEGREQNLSIITEVTEIKEKEEELLRMSRIDPLTGLYNKAASISRCQIALEKQKDSLHALMVIDIDNFKGINDHLGHIFGDTVLIEVSARLKKLFRTTDVIGRVGGDEFIVFMTDICSRQAAEDKADEICAVFRNTYMGDTENYKISCSVGIAYSGEGDDYQKLFHKADVALYKSKSKGKNQVFVYHDEEKMERNPIKKNKDRTEMQEKESRQLELKERVFELLYSSVDFVGSIKMALALLGRILDVDKIYIFENSSDNTMANNTYEWYAQGVVSRGKNKTTVPVQAIKLFDYFDENGIFSCGDVNELPADIMRFFEIHRVRSFTQVAVVENGVICGFIGFDNMTKNATPTPEQLEIMAFAAKVIGVFILKKRAEDGVVLYNQNKMAALDAMPNRIYIIDKSFKIQYMNDLTKSIATKAREGDYCFRAFMENSAPCNDCPALKCGEKSASSQIYNPQFDSHLISNASRITWQGDDRMVLLCCQDLHPKCNK